MSPDFLSSSPARIGHPPIDFADHASPHDGPVQEQPETVYSRRMEAPWSGGSGGARCACLSAVRPHFTACPSMHSSMSYTGAIRVLEQNRSEAPSARMARSRHTCDLYSSTPARNGKARQSEGAAKARV